jgi:hypothetical protein
MEKYPTPDIILSNQIASEQYVMNRLTGTGKPWTRNTGNITTVADQAEYELTPSAGATFGKALFMYRDLGENTILPIPFTEFTGEFTDQRYEFWVAPFRKSNPVVSGEKVAFYRKDGNSVWLRFYPVPTEVLAYTLFYASGALDWDSLDWSDEPILPEFSRFRQLYAALACVAKCRWDGYAPQDNAAYRRELRADLQAEFLLHEAEFRPFIRHTNHESNISEVGFYYE